MVGFFALKSIFKSRKQRCPNPPRGMCRSASAWGIWVEDRTCTALWSENPETDFSKDLRAALQLQLTAQNVSCQTGWQPRAWQIQDPCWLSGTCWWVGTSSEFRNSLPSPEPHGASWIYSQARVPEPWQREEGAMTHPKLEGRCETPDLSIPPLDPAIPPKAFQGCFSSLLEWDREARVWPIREAILWTECGRDFNRNINKWTAFSKGQTVFEVLMVEGYCTI